MRQVALCSLSLALALAAAAPRAGGQGLSRRISSARDGVVALTYPVRDGVCGNGRTFIGDDADQPFAFKTYMLDGTSFSSVTGGDMRQSCRTGPARVLLTVRDGSVVELRPYVGPSDQLPTRFDTDLGSVSGDEAARALLDLARRGSERIARNAVLGASIAEGARISATLSQFAGDRSLRIELREVALRWLLPAAEREDDRRATEIVRRIAGDREDEVVVRERAIRVLGEAQGSDAFLRELYPRLDHTGLKERVLRVLGETRTEANLRWITTVARSESEPLGTRERAVRVLGEEGDRLRELREMYPTLREPTLRERIVRMNGEQGDAESRRWLRAIAERDAEPIAARERAIRVLAESGDETYLREAFFRIDETALRERIVRSLGETGGTENLRWLREVAGSTKADEALRERAVRSLAEAGVPTAELVQLYDRSESSAVRMRLISALAERGDRAARDKLAAIARADPDPDMRRRALRRVAELAGEK